MRRLATDAIARTVDKGHGRLEVRTVEVTTRLRDYLDWPGAGSVLRITRDVTRGGKTSREVAYAISDLTATRISAEGFLDATRKHWRIENDLHWQRDVNFAEDRCRVRSGGAAQVLAAARNAVLAILRCAGFASIAAALRKLSLDPRLALRLFRRA